MSALPPGYHLLRRPNGRIEPLADLFERRYKLFARTLGGQRIGRRLAARLLDAGLVGHQQLEPLRIIKFGRAPHAAIGALYRLDHAEARGLQ
jgi:hypothetical protein